MKALRIISRIIVGLVFIFSGFVKSVDPVGFSYKLQEYLIAYGFEWLIPAAIIFAVLSCLIEFVLGIALIFGVFHRFTSWASLIVMSFFTVLTFLSALYNPVSDCGCFGDAIHLTNWETFYKNVVLMVFVLILLFTYKKEKIYYPKIVEFVIVIIGGSILIFISVYSYRHLPLIDFLPWKEGNKIADYVITKQEVSKIFLVYKNKKTGEIKEYPSDNYPWQDTVWMANWQFVEQKKEIISEFKDAPIHDFTITDEEGNNYTKEVINNTKYHFILVISDISNTKKKVFNNLIDFVKKCDKDSINFIGLTGSSPNLIDPFRHEVQAMFPIYSTDETALKTMIRSNPGLILMKDGIVIKKWHFNDFPVYEDFETNYLAIK